MYNNYNTTQTTLRIPEQWERVLAYSLFWVSGLILLLVEQRNQTVRRHAAQSVVIFGTLSLIGLGLGILGAIPIIGGFFGIIGGAVNAIGIVLWIVLMIMAFFSAKTFISGPRYERFF